MALYHNVFGRIAARMPELLFGNGIGPELLAHEVARIVVRVHVVFAVAELLHKRRGGVAQVQRHRQIPRALHFLESRVYGIRYAELLLATGPDI